MLETFLSDFRERGSVIILVPFPSFGWRTGQTREFGSCAICRETCYHKRIGGDRIERYGATAVHGHGPSPPPEELETPRHWRGPALCGSALTTSMAEFCQSGISIVLASCDGTPSPVIGRGVACRVAGEATMRVVLRNSSNGALLKALGRSAGLAVTFTQPTTHLSLQLKSPSARIVAADAFDVPAALAQSAKFREELMAVGYSNSFAAAYCGFEPHDLLTITFTPEQAFLQTPGPNAGSALT